MSTTQMIQFALLGGTSALFIVAFVLAVRQARRLAREAAAARLPGQFCIGNTSRVFVVAGTLAGLGLLLWRAIAFGSPALLMSTPFDTFLAFALLVALTAAYFCWTRHLRPLSFFLLPMVVLLLLLGLLLSLWWGGGGPEASYFNVWTAVHMVTLIAATGCFALACAGGGVYLLAVRQLRRKGLDASHRWIGLPALESVEHFNRWLIYGGFPLLSIATVAGILRMSGEHPVTTAPGAGHAKIAMGILSWLVYAVLLHVPLNPSFRGPRAAWLSIAGFILFLATFVVAYWK